MDTLSDSIWINKLGRFGLESREFHVIGYQDFIWATEDCTEVQWFSDKWNNKSVDWKTFVSATTDNICSSVSTQQKDMIIEGTKTFSRRNRTLVRCKRNYIKWAISSAIPLIVYITSVLFVWWRDERGLSKLLLFPVVLCGLYSQYRAIKVILIILGRWPNKNQNEWKKEKKTYTCEVSSLEPVLEALPSIIIQISLVASELEAFFVHGRPSPLADNWKLFLFAFNLSLLMTVLGLVHFLKDGPSPLISSEGLADGFLTTRFAALYFSIFFWFTAKCCILVGVIYSFIIHYQCYQSYIGFNIGQGILTGVFLWSATLLLPQLIHSFVLLTMATKRRVLSFCINFPSFVIIPLFTPFTYEGSPIDGKYQFHVSIKHSIVNILFTYLLTPLTMIFYYFDNILNWAYSFELTPDVLDEYKFKISEYHESNETLAAENEEKIMKNHRMGVQFQAFIVVILPFLLILIATIPTMVLLMNSSNNTSRRQKHHYNCFYEHVGMIKWNVKYPQPVM